MGKKGPWPRSRDLLFKFWDPLLSPEWLKIQILNFACRLVVRDPKPKNKKKMGQKRRSLSHVIYFTNFGTPLLSPEWLKIQNSNLARRLIVRNTKPKNKKWFKRGRGLGHVTYFSNFGTPIISLERLKILPQILQQFDHKGFKMRKMKN